MERTLEQNLSPRELQKLKNNRTGLLIFQISWILVFVCLFVFNLLVRSNFPSWPPPGVARLDAGLPTIATLGLLASAALAHRAYNALRTGERQPFLIQLRITLGLGIAFVLIMAYEWLAVPASGQYSTLFRVMTAFHGIHALVIGLYLWRTYRFVRAGVYGPQQFWPVEAGVKLWDFVVVAWLLFFSVLYIL